MTGITLTIHFPTVKDRDIFLAWLADGGGEYEFMEYTDTTVTEFDYSQPEVDGQPVVILLADSGEGVEPLN